MLTCGTPLASITKTPPMRALPSTRFVALLKLIRLTPKDSTRIYNGPPFLYQSPGACFLDYDADGRIDIFLANNGVHWGMSLYRNLGNGKFEDVTRTAGLDPALHGVGCTAGDYDNDGATDLAVTVEGSLLLLHNEKNGTFNDVTEASGVKLQGLGINPTFIDYD